MTAGPGETKKVSAAAGEQGWLAVQVGRARRLAGKVRRRLRRVSERRVRRVRENLWAPAPLIEFDDYENYWVQRGRVNWILRRWTLATEWIEDDASVLDVGCGSGEFLEYLVANKPGVRCRGFDISAEAVRIAREAGVDAAVLDPSTSDFTGYYDYVTCFEVLEHIVDAERVLRRIRQCAAKRVIISVPNAGSIDCRLRLMLFGRFPITRCMMHIKEHVRFWTLRDFKDWIAAHEMSIVAVHGDWGIPFTPWRLLPSMFAKGAIFVIDPCHGTPEPACTEDLDN